MPDPFKQVKIIELMELFDDEEVTTADQVDRPERAIERQAIDDFMERNPQADGGRIGLKRGNPGGEAEYQRKLKIAQDRFCLLYTSPSPRDS